MIAQTLTPTQADTVAQTAWDHDAFASHRDTLPPLAEATDELAQVSALGADMARDVFAALHKRAPQPADQVPASHIVNRLVRDAMFESPSYQDLHKLCAGDKFSAAMATAAMRKELAGLYEQMGDVQDAADAAQAAQEQLEQAATEAMAGGGPPSDEAVAELNAMREAADQLGDVAEAKAADAAGEIGRAVRAGLAEGLDDALATKAAAAAWGLEGGEVASMDPTARLARMNELRSPPLGRIAEHLGRMKALSVGAKERRWRHGPDEIYDVVLGDDLNRVLPSELAALDEPGLEDMFWARYTNKELACYELRTRERVGRGPVVIIEDSSLSMAEDGRYEWAKALGLRIAGLVGEDGRACHAVIFGGRAKMVDVSIDGTDLDSMLDYARLFLADAGTEFSGPLDRGADLIETSPVFAEADLVFVTDGRSQLTDEWVEAFQARKERVGFRVWAVTIACPTTKAVRQVADRVADLTDIASADADTTAAAIFTDLTTERP